MAVDPEFLCDMLTDSNGSDGADRNHSGEGIEVGIPKTMRNDWTGEIGKSGCKREEATAVFTVASCDLGKEGIFEFALEAAMEAGDITEVFVEGEPHSEAKRAIDSCNPLIRGKPLHEARKISTPFRRPLLRFRVKSADGGTDLTVEEISVAEVVEELIFVGGLIVRYAVD